MVEYTKTYTRNVILPSGEVKTYTFGTSKSGKEKIIETRTGGKVATTSTGGKVIVQGKTTEQRQEEAQVEKQREEYLSAKFKAEAERRAIEQEAESRGEKILWTQQVEKTDSTGKKIFVEQYSPESQKFLTGVYTGYTEAQAREQREAEAIKTQKNKTYTTSSGETYSYESIFSEAPKTSKVSRFLTPIKSAFLEGFSFQPTAKQRVATGTGAEATAYTLGLVTSIATIGGWTGKIVGSSVGSALVKYPRVYDYFEKISNVLSSKPVRYTLGTTYATFKGYEAYQSYQEEGTSGLYRVGMTTVRDIGFFKGLSSGINQRLIEATKTMTVESVSNQNIEYSQEGNVVKQSSYIGIAQKPLGTGKIIVSGETTSVTPSKSFTFTTPKSSILVQPRQTLSFFEGRSYEVYRPLFSNKYVLSSQAPKNIYSMSLTSAPLLQTNNQALTLTKGSGFAGSYSRSIFLNLQQNLGVQQRIFLTPARVENVNVYKTISGGFQKSKSLGSLDIFEKSKFYEFVSSNQIGFSSLNQQTISKTITTPKLDYTKLITIPKTKLTPVTTVKRFTRPTILTQTKQKSISNLAPTITRQISQQKYGLMTGSITQQKTEVFTTSESTTKAKTTTRQSSRQRLIPAFKPTMKPTTKTITRQSSRQTIKNIPASFFTKNLKNVIDIPKINFGFKISSFKRKEFRTIKSKKSKAKYGYTPSVTAVLNKLTGSTSEAGLKSGLAIRPIKL